MTAASRMLSGRRRLSKKGSPPPPTSSCRNPCPPTRLISASPRAQQPATGRSQPPPSHPTSAAPGLSSRRATAQAGAALTPAVRCAVALPAKQSLRRRAAACRCRVHTTRPLRCLSATPGMSCRGTRAARVRWTAPGPMLTSPAPLSPVQHRRLPTAPPQQRRPASPPTSA